MRMTSLRRLCAGSLVAIAMTGCASTEPRYYTLAGAVESYPDGNYRNADEQPPFRIELQPIQVPERMNRTGVLVRVGGAAQVLEDDRWSAPFPEEFRDALAQRLQHGLVAVDRYKGGVTRGERVFRVSVDIVQIDAELDGSVGAVLNWLVKSVPDGKVLSGQTRAVLPAPGGVQGVIGAYQQVVINVASDLRAAVLRMAQSEAAHVSTRD